MKSIHIISGGTRVPVDSHLYLGSKASGSTGRILYDFCWQKSSLETHLHLTRMADPESVESSWDMDTPEDVRDRVKQLAALESTKILFLPVAIVDFSLDVGLTGDPKQHRIKSVARDARLVPTPKILTEVRKHRKDIFLVAFKQTTGATEQEQYLAGLNLLKEASCNLVLANDSVTRKNMIIVPEEAAYMVTTDRQAALEELVDMALLRSHLTFTRSTVIDGEPVPWESDLVPASLRRVVDHCIERGAYKKFRGVTAGHFAVKLNETTFLTSRRKTDFNDMKNVGLVKVTTDGPDSVIAYGSRPSVGGQSQRIVFEEHPDSDCVVHFHCVKRPESLVPTVSQREFECGSHQCGRNTSRGLKKFGNLQAVYLNSHGPNIVFSRDIDPEEVIRFIDHNFDLTTKTGGYAVTP